MAFTYVLDRLPIRVRRLALGHCQLCLNVRYGNDTVKSPLATSSIHRELFLHLLTAITVSAQPTVSSRIIIIFVTDAFHESLSLLFYKPIYTRVINYQLHVSARFLMFWFLLRVSIAFKYFFYPNYNNSKLN